VSASEGKPKGVNASKTHEICGPRGQIEDLSGCGRQSRKSTMEGM
jgi:hypothetical protein